MHGIDTPVTEPDLHQLFFFVAFSSFISSFHEMHVMYRGLHSLTGASEETTL